MAELDRAGIQLVVEGLNQVLSDLNAYNQAVRQAGTASTTASRQITDLGVRWNAALQRFQQTGSLGKGGGQIASAAKALDIALKSVIQTIKQTGVTIAGIKWDAGIRQFVNATTGAIVPLDTVKRKIQDFGQATGAASRQAAQEAQALAQEEQRAADASARSAQRRAVSLDSAISAHSRMVGVLRQSTQAEQAGNAATQASVGFFQRLGESIRGITERSQEFLRSGTTVQNILRQQGQAAQQAGQATQQLGVNWQQVARDFVAAGSDVSKQNQVLIGALRSVGQESQAIQKALTSNNAAVRASAVKLAQAQLGVAKAQQAATDAVAKAADAQGDNVEENEQAIIAIQKYQVALARATLAQNNFNQQLQAAKPPPVFTQIKNLAQGVQGVFTSILGPIQNAIAFIGKFIVAIGIAKAASIALNGALSILKGAFNLLVSPIRKAFEALQTLFRATTIIAFGVLLRDTIRNIIREIKALAASAIEAVASFQTLTLRLEIMEARMLRDMDATMSFADSMEVGAQRAKGLIKWIKELALTAPFDVSVIGNTLSLNLAMGFMETQAKDLTQAILGYTAAMGLGPEIMERITFNLGQMKAAGKVTATEMRDLARGAFFPLTRVLDIAAQKLGIASNNLVQFRKDAAEGKIDVNTFFEAFIEMVRTDFPNAVEKFGQTLTGVRQRLTNFFKTILGLEILAPLGSAIARSMNGLLNVLLSPKVQLAARLYGRILVAGFEQVASVIRVFLIPALKDLADAIGLPIPSAMGLAQVLANIAFGAAEGLRRLSALIRKIAEEIRSRFDNMSGSMFNAGANIIKQLARGILAGVTFVIRAIGVVARAISSLLEAKSPPKILPELPKWGMKAMEEYLKGFSLADFSVLNELQDPIERVLKLLVDTGKIAEKQFGKIFVRISEDIAKVLAGKITPEKLFGDIRKSTGPFAKSLIELAKRQLELAKATDRVREAEERLERARQREKDLRATLNKQIFQYNQRVREGAGKEELKNRLGVINATAREAAKATKQVSIEEKRLELAQQQLKAWEEQVELQKQLVDQLIKLTEAQIIQVDVDTSSIGGAIGDAIEEAIGDLPPIGAGGLFPSDADIQAKVAELFRNARKAVLPLFDSLAREIAPIWDLVFGKEVVLTGGFKEGDLKKIGIGRAGGVIDDLIETFNKFSSWFDENGPKITKVLDAIIGALDSISIPLDIMRAAIEKTFGIDKGGLSWATIIVVGFLTALGTIAAGISGVISGIVTAATFITEAFGTAFTLISAGLPLLTGTFTEFVTGIVLIFEGVGAIIVGVFGSILAFFAGFVKGIIDFALRLYDELVRNSIIPEMMSAIYDSIVGTLEDISALWEAIWQSMVDFLSNNIAAPIQRFIDTTLTNLKNFISTTLTNALNTFRTSVLQPLSTFFNTTLPNAIDTFLNKAREIGQTISGEVTTLLNAFRTNVLAPLASGFDSVVSAIKRAVDWVQTLIDRLKKLPVKIVDRFIGKSPSPFEIGLTGAAKAMRKLANQALPQLTANLNAIPVSKPSVAAAPVSMAGAQSFSNIVSVNMGGVNIMNGMDEAQFEAKVLHIVRRGIGL